MCERTVLPLPEAPAMRLPRVRFSVRAMMIAVAIVAAGLGYVHHKRSAAFRRLADANARKAEARAEKVKRYKEIWEAMDRELGYGAEYLIWRERFNAWVGDRRDELVDQFKRDLDHERAIFDYYRGLEEKYQRAAAFPWLPVAPDPPPPVSMIGTASASTAGGGEEVPPDALAVVASLPKGAFEQRVHPTFGGAIPLTIEYRNRSVRPITVCPISLVIVTDADGHEPELTTLGRSYRQAAATPPGEARRKHSTIRIEPGGSFRDEGLDLTALYRLLPGRYSVRVIHNDDPPGVTSAPVPFRVRRVNSRH